jgi:hypothetical protein
MSMKGHWVRIRKIEQDGETMYESRCDLFPDAVVFEDKAEDAVSAMCDVVDALVIEMAKKLPR